MRTVVLVSLLAMVAPVLTGCLTAELPPEVIEPAEKGASSDALTAFLHDISEEIPGIDILDSIVEHARVPAADGTFLDTWIVRPDVAEPVPLVLTVTPYYGGGSPINEGKTSHFLGRVGDALVPRGYAVGISSVRGTGNSGGCFTQGGLEESRDTAAVIEHLAKEPWSNGNVGLIGVSYPGTTPQDVWVQTTPSLKTIVPISGISDFYKYNFVNGVPIVVQGFAFNTYYWPMVGLSPAQSGPNFARDPMSLPGTITGEFCTDQVDVQEGGASSTVDGNKDAYWISRDYGYELLHDGEAKKRASVFYIHGLQDWNVKPHHMEGWLEAIQDEGVPYKVWLGQWGHNWPQREDWWNTTLVAWFDQFLKEIDTGILDAPPVQVQNDDGVWRNEARWPPHDVDELIFHLQADGTLSDSPGVGNASYNDHSGKDPMIEVDGDRIIFVSEPLTEDLVISGLPRFEGTVTADGRKASLMLTLLERTPDGDRAINYAAQSLNHAKNPARGVDQIMNDRLNIRVSFFPQDDIVHAGNRLVLVAAGNLLTYGPGPSLQPIATGSIITIDLDGAVLKLPIDRTIVPEDPQPCWEAKAGGKDCYLIR